MKWGKTALIVVCAVIVTALGIDAADTLTGSSGTLLSQVVSSDLSKCPLGMSAVDNNVTVTCVDTYEASASDKCPKIDPDNQLASNLNVEDASCTAESKSDALPWRFINRDQAMQMCARSGKRLPTSKEWYQLGLGMGAVEANCNITSGNLSKTGEYEACVSPHSAYDMVGNVWEWVSDDVIDGKYNERILPDSGYVAQVDDGGVATAATSTEQESYGSDYFWSSKEGAFGIIRGGYYDNDTDAGLYIVHADTLPSAAGTAIGFRCVK